MSALTLAFPRIAREAQPLAACMAMRRLALVRAGFRLEALASTAVLLDLSGASGLEAIGVAQVASASGLGRLLEAAGLPVLDPSAAVDLLPPGPSVPWTLVDASALGHGQSQTSGANLSLALGLFLVSGIRAGVVATPPARGSLLVLREPPSGLGRREARLVQDRLAWLAVNASLLGSPPRRTAHPGLSVLALGRSRPVPTWIEALCSAFQIEYGPGF